MLHNKTLSKREGGKEALRFYRDKQPIPMVGLGPASLVQDGSTHRHRCCAGLAHQVLSPLINVRESRSVALGFPASTLSLSRLSGSPFIPLISLLASRCCWLCEVPWIYTSL